MSAEQPSTCVGMAEVAMDAPKKSICVCTRENHCKCQGCRMDGDPNGICAATGERCPKHHGGVARGVTWAEPVEVAVLDPYMDLEEGDSAGDTITQSAGDTTRAETHAWPMIAKRRRHDNAMCSMASSSVAADDIASSQMAAPSSTALPSQMAARPLLLLRPPQMAARPRPQLLLLGQPRPPILQPLGPQAAARQLGLPQPERPPWADALLYYWDYSSMRWKKRGGTRVAEKGRGKGKSKNKSKGSKSS
jgi:hypothetical protein